MVTTITIITIILLICYIIYEYNVIVIKVECWVATFTGV